MFNPPFVMKDGLEEGWIKEKGWTRERRMDGFHPSSHVFDEIWTDGW